jgi:hypothetical protein
MAKICGYYMQAKQYYNETINKFQTKPDYVFQVYAKFAINTKILILL